MKELSQIRMAVLDALRGAGIQAMEVFPGKQAMAYSGVVAAVGVGAASGKTAGFCHYLGEMKDPETQAVRERYGKELFGQITVELRANRAADCERSCETATEVLLGGLPEGVRTGELTWEAICWEKTTGMFLRRGVLECRALFLAESAVESGEFLDFRLKGVLLCKQAAKNFHTICKKETALKRVLSNLLSAVSLLRFKAVFSCGFRVPPGSGLYQSCAAGSVCIPAGQKYCSPRPRKSCPADRKTPGLPSRCIGHRW